jgi:PKD repeat protein
MLAVVTGTLVLASACSGDGVTPPTENTAPVASFAVPPCTINVPCDFVSTSTDDAQVTAWSWDFDGDGNADATTASASFTYATAGTFNVSLTVHDAQGLSQTKTNTITIAPVNPANTPPTAGFTNTCNAADCSFTSTSTDAAPGTIATYAWDFGDGATADVNNPTHSYTVTAPTDFTVTLTVTDNEGATDVETQTVSVAPPNTPPTAGFTHTCNAANCSFTSTSTDAAPGTIATYAWDFGDGGTSAVSNPSHGYAVVNPTDFTVTLTVTDNEGATDLETQTITVAPSAPPNTPPTAGFSHTCNAAHCSFTSTSTDVAPGTIATYAWDFGDGATAALSNPSHGYAVINPTDFTVTLTVTDNEGATDVESQTVSVAPPPPGAEGCTTSGTRVDCLLDIAERSNIKLKLTGISCTLYGERVVIPPPSGDQVFLYVCLRAVGDSTKIFGGPGDSAFVYEAGSQATIRFRQGTADAGEPTPSAPVGQLTGSFPNWTINFEDGANPGGPGEPDFTDVVLQVEAIPAH